MKIGELRPPAENIERLGGIGHERRWISRPPRCETRQYPLASYPLYRLNYLQNRMTSARTQIERVALASFEQVLQRQDVSIGQIRYMRVISDRSPILGAIVGSIDLDRIA